MADSDAPEHKDRGLFGLFGKKDEKADGHVQQQSYGVDTHAAHAPPVYTGQGQHNQPPAVYQHPQQYGQGESGNAYGGEVHHAPPSAMSQQTQHYGQEDCGNKQHEGKLHRSNSSSSSSDEEEDEEDGKKEGRKKKGMKDNKRTGYRGETETQEVPEKRGLMDKIKEKIPGHKGEENRY